MAILRFATDTTPREVLVCEKTSLVLCGKLSKLIYIYCTTCRHGTNNLGKRVRVKVRVSVSVRVSVRVRLRARVRDLNCLDRSWDMKLFWKLFLEKVLELFFENSFGNGSWKFWEKGFGLWLGLVLGLGLLLRLGLGSGLGI